MPHPVRVLLVEDEPAVRAQLADLLRRSAGIVVLDAVGSLAAALAAVARLRPQVLITDLRLPDGHGITLIRETRALLPDTGIMVISVLADEGSVVAAIRAGAGGYVLKDDLPEDFERAIRDLIAGNATLSPAIARHIVTQLRSGSDAPQGPRAEDVLTPREQEVLVFIAKGLSNADIGTRLGISAHTVGDHIKNIYRKLEVKSRTEAVVLGISRRMLYL